jgi:hypothetical protein
MKQFLLCTIFLFSITCCNAQKNHRHYYDSLLQKNLQKYIGHPDCNTCDSAGMVLLHFFKIKDSIHIDILYASDRIYEGDIKNAVRWINKRSKAAFRNKYRALVPLYFRYVKADGDAPEIRERQKILLQQQIKKQRHKAHILQPVTIIGYAPVRKAK